MSYMFAPLKKYAQFSGRARRKEYWAFHLLTFAAPFLLMCSFGPTSKAGSNALGMVMLIAVVGLAIPSLAVSVRRLHDIGKSGWWIFIGCVPFIGGLWSLILMLTNGQIGENQYGPDPKEPERLLPSARVV